MVATWILPSTLEDILAIVLAGLAGYVALLNLPLRRAEAKAKLEKVANNFIQVRHIFTSTNSCGLSDSSNEGQPLARCTGWAESPVSNQEVHTLAQDQKSCMPSWLRSFRRGSRLCVPEHPSIAEVCHPGVCCLPRLQSR